MSITPRAPILRLILPEIPVALGLATGVAALAHWGPTGPADGAAGLAWTAWLIAAIVAAVAVALSPPSLSSLLLSQSSPWLLSQRLSPPSPSAPSSP